MEIEAYCMDCARKVIVRDAQPTTLNNGTPVWSGPCPKCSATLWKDATRFVREQKAVAVQRGEAFRWQGIRLGRAEKVKRPKQPDKPKGGIER